MKKIRTFLWVTLLLPLFIVSSTGIHAGEVTIKKVKNVALNLYTERSGNSQRNAGISDIIEEKENGITAFYVLVYDKKGFAIVAADDAVRPVLGYSFECVYDENNHSPAFEYFILKRMKEQIYAVIQTNQTPEPETASEWAKYSSAPENFMSDEVKSGFPLTRTLWGQGQYFNTQCPPDPNGPDGHALVGCVATAMAQVLNYWQHPWHGTGSHSYTPENHPEYGAQFADFSTAVYNFDHMPDTVNDYSDDLAELMYHCAVSVDMNFGPDVSGASGWGNNDISYALEHYFYFNEAVNDLNRSSYPGSLWTDLLNEELDLNRPIIYGAGDNDDEVGHAWVIDDYTTGDMYHCNWGWSGNDNGYYLMDDFAVNGHVFDDSQTACVHIYPKNAHVSGTWDLAGSPYYLNYDYYVDPGNELIIEPGVEVIYNGRYKLEVRGRLDAQGTASDSILFHSGWPEVGTRGVSFSNTNDYSADSSKLAFCKFEDGRGVIKDFIVPDDLYGGSVSCINSSRVSVSECTIISSSAARGGAIACTDNSAISIHRCVIKNDSASSAGGGIYLSESNSVLKHNLIENNKCAWSNGGGVSCYYSQATFDTDTIRDNHARFGAAVGLVSSDVVLENVVIQNNEANVDGGGIYMMESSPEMNGVHFNSNMAGDLGGAMLCYSNSNPQVNQTLINYNYADEGAAIAIVDAHPTLSHVTMTANNLAPDGEAVYVRDGSYTFINSISWDNFHADIDTSGTCTVNLMYSIIQTGPWTGTGVVKKDPLFADPWIPDYHLRWDGFPIPDEVKSPAIDHGDPASPLDPDGTRADMGAFPFEQVYTSLPGGNISGTLTCAGSPYYVEGDIILPAAEQLVIEPCVTLIFQGYYRFEVRGRLLAEGTESDRITFAPADTIEGWRGLRFINTKTNGQDSSKLVNCRITFGNAHDSYGDYYRGGAIYSKSSGDLLVKNCLLNKNRAEQSGGAIYSTGAGGPFYLNNIIENNYAPNGGAVYGNSAGDFYFTNNLFQNNRSEKGGAFSAYSSNIYLAGNTIRNNRAEKFGGAVYYASGGNFFFDNVNKNEVYLNYAGAAGLDFYYNGYQNSTTVIVDTFTVLNPHKHFTYPFAKFNMTVDNGLIPQVDSDLYVSMTGSDENSGTSEAEPLKTMYMACLKILADEMNPHTIFLDEGTYSEGATGEVFPVNWRSNVSLHGKGISKTIIYGEEKNQLLYCYDDSGFLTDSIMFQGGYGEYGGGIRFEHYSSPEVSDIEVKNNFALEAGGGIYCNDYSNPQFNQVNIHDNSSENDGGGIALENYCDATIMNCEVNNNFTIYSGGGMYIRFYSNATIDSCNINGNTAAHGGGLFINWGSHPTVKNSVITGNDALNHVSGYFGTGGGLWISYNSSPEINNVGIRHNHADANGGGIYSESQVYAKVKSCFIEYNSANSGAGLYLSGNANHRYVNTVIAGNHTNSSNGGGIYLTGAHPTFTNVTITGNTADTIYSGGALYNFNSNPVFNNSILRDNFPDEINVYSGTVTANYCDVDGSVTGTGNFYADPMFGGLYGNYDILEGSPCIDAGTPDTTGMNLPGFDIAGNLRIVDDRIDIGAYEFQESSAGNLLLHLVVFLEGPYNGIDMNTELNGLSDFPMQQPYNQPPWNYAGTETLTSIPSGMVDWVLVELRDAPDAASATPETTVGQQACVLMQDGSVRNSGGSGNVYFSGLTVTENLFVIVRHRNHPGVLSANPLVEAGGLYSYDFTTPDGQAFGTDAQKDLGNGYFGLFAGDANADGVVDTRDMTVTWKADAGRNGYLNGDLNLDTQADNKDKNDFWAQNNGSVSGLPFECGYILIDDRDGQSYRTVQIGMQCWMAENLNIGDMITGGVDQTDNAVFEKYCFDNDPAECDIRGGLYQWNEMMQYVTTEGTQGICPPDWHVPSDEEWKQLEGEVDSGFDYPDPEWDGVGWRGTDAGGNLKESGTLHWASPNTGATNSSGFTCRPGGVCSTTGNFTFPTSNSNFWTSSAGTTAWIRQITYDDTKVNRYGTALDYGLSVRCVKD